MEDSNNNSLSVLPEDEMLNGNMSNEQFCEFQNQLWLLLGQRTERYTMGDSSSVPIEVAEELLKSIYYCIALCSDTNNHSIILSQIKVIDVQELFSLGLLEVKRQIRTGKELLSKAKDGILQINNEFYQSVISQMSLFFKKYDYHFFAHDISCMIDYPLCHPSQEKQGIEYINMYASYFLLENDFCRQFNVDTIHDLLEAYSPDCNADFINIYELVANNALALTLMQKNIFTLDVCETDCRYITKHLLSIAKETAVNELICASKKLCCQLGIVDPNAVAYLKKTAMVLLAKIKVSQQLNYARGVFYSLCSQKGEETKKIQYIDRKTMDNQTLRSLIDEIANCRFVADKIIIVQQKVHSLRDLTEVLNVSFWGDECLKLFHYFDNAEISILLHYITQKKNLYPSWQSASDWETEFLNYFDKMEVSQKLEIQQLQ